ncbi:MAG TPA: hypothetical protein VFN20_08110 [Candidatus Acidoferrum sp.]|nr:hypothetical protein [Candidatus Acidoferrum sp.]
MKKLTAQVKGATGGLLVDRTYEDLLETGFISQSRATGKNIGIHD